MKSFLNKLLVVSGFALLALSSCKKDDAVLTATSGSPGTLSSTSSTLVLTTANLTSVTPVETFNFVQANFGYNAAVTNTLQIDVASDNWANPYTITLSPNIFTQGYNTNDLNNILLKLGLKAKVSGQVVARMKSSISATTFVYSNVLTLTFTPAAPLVVTSYIYVVGAFQGWNASSPDSLVSATGNGVYVGIINYTAGNNEFLILPAKNYNNKYATTETAAPTATVTYNAGNNLKAPTTAGQYLVTFNMNAGTITFALANLYSVIGSTTPGGNYSTDLDFTKYVNNVNGYWTGTFAQTAGAFKIRQNHDWTYSWGDISPADGKTATSANGGNINVATAGNYLINFIIPPTAIGTTPSVAAAYTLTKQ